VYLIVHFSVFYPLTIITTIVKNEYCVIVHIYACKELTWSLLKWVICGLQTSSGHQMLGVHHSAMTTVHFGKIARKHGLTGVCLDLLSRYAVRRVRLS